MKLLLYTENSANCLQTSLHNDALHSYVEVDDITSTVEMKPCVAYVTQEKVLMGMNLAYNVSSEISITEMKQCAAYVAQRKHIMDVNPAYEEIVQA